MNGQQGVAVSYASVVLFNLRDSSVVEGMLSDEQGMFRMSEIPPGRHRLEIRFPGFHTYLSPVHHFSPRLAESWEWNCGDIFLEEDITQLDEAVVIEQSSVMEMRVDRKVFYVGSDLTNRGGNTTELLENIPSVTVDIDGNISLRGSTGVQILIDGRPSGLSGGAREAFLESLPASAVERVELITNPSARFDPDGTAGILNIVLKKNRLEGFSGQLQGTFGTGDNHDANASLNYRNSKITLSNNLGWNDRWMFMKGETERIQYWSGDSVSTSWVNRPGDSHRGSLSASTRLEWRPMDALTLFTGFNGNTGIRDGWDSTATQETWTGGTLDNLSTSALRTEWGESDSEGSDLFAGWERTLGKQNHKWTGDVRKSTSSRHSITHFVDTSLVPGASLDPVRTFNGSNTETNRWLAQSDLILPWGDKGKIELGVKGTWNQETSQFTYTEYDSTELRQGIYIPFGLDTVNYAFRYGENIYAAYLTAGKTFGIVGFQGGLRTEQVLTSARLEGAGNLDAAPFENDYFRVYPSANFYVETDDEHTFSVSYSRRVNRPRGRQLNPYLDMSDPRNHRSGNPFLLPEFTNSYEISHQWQKQRSSVTSSLFFKDTRDVIRRFTSADSTTGILLSDFQNLGRQHNEGLEIAVMTPIGQSGRLTWSASAYRIVNDGSNLDSPFGTSGLSWSSRMFASWTLGELWKLQANGFVRGASVTPQGRFNGFTTFNLAASRNLRNDNWQMTFQVKDVFNTRRWSYNTTTEQFSQEVWRQRESRNLFVSLQYNFGKLEERRGKGSSGRGSGGDGGDSFMME